MCRYCSVLVLICTVLVLTCTVLKQKSLLKMLESVDERVIARMLTKGYRAFVTEKSTRMRTRLAELMARSTKQHVLRNTESPYQMENIWNRGMQPQRSRVAHAHSLGRRRYETMRPTAVGSILQRHCTCTCPSLIETIFVLTPNRQHVCVSVVWMQLFYLRT